MLSDAIKQERREVDEGSQGGKYGLTPGEAGRLIRLLEFWSIEARNMEERLAVFGPHAPILPVSVEHIVPLRRLP